MSTVNDPVAAKPKKPLYKKAWFWLLIILTAIVLLFAGCATLLFGAAGAVDEASEPTAVESSESVTEPEPSEAEAPTASEEPAEAPEPKGPEETTAQKNAVNKAEDYLAFSGFSRDGLVKQLEFDQFTNEDATYAADNVKVDYDEQAAKKAKSYLDFSSFSRDGLITQLEFDGFTPEQAAFGADSVDL